METRSLDVGNCIFKWYLQIDFNGLGSCSCSLILFLKVTKVLSSRTWRLVRNTALLKLVFVLANLSALYLPGSVCLGLFFTVSFSTLGLAWLSQHPRETCLSSMTVCQAVPACFLLLHFNMTARGRHYTLPLLTALFSKTGLRNF